MSSSFRRIACLRASNAINLASPRLGAEVLYATDDFFADKARMIQDAPAQFDPDKYDDNGKYMDGWESRRRRQGGHDFCIVKLGARGMIRGVDIDTSHFTGNYPPAASIEACVSDGDPGDGTQLGRDTSRRAARPFRASLSCNSQRRILDASAPPYLSRTAAWRACASMASLCRPGRARTAMHSTNFRSPIMAGASSPITTPIMARSGRC